jgi:uncharacterized protein with PQ loop repeat
MEMTTVLGGIGTGVGLVRAVPQLKRLLRSGNPHGVSVDTAATSSIISFGWASYGSFTGQLPVATATFSSGVVFAAIACVALRLGRGLNEIKTAVPWFFVLLIALVVKGTGGLGAILAFSVLVGNLPQVITSFRESDLGGLSLATWLFSMADGTVWLAYSLFAHDSSILAFGILQLTTSSIIVARRATWTGAKT